MMRLIAAAAAAWLAMATAATAQNSFPTPAGSNALGSVAMCPSAANNALKVPCDSTNPLPTTPSGSAAVTVADGADVTQGTTTDAACGTDNGTCTVEAVLKRIAQRITTAYTSIVLQAGANIIGKVGIDQTTPGTTNGVQVNAALPAGTNNIGKVSIDPAMAGITPVVSASAEATHVLKASAGSLWSVYATNLTATPGFLAILNATSAPADGAITPLECIPLPASGAASINYNSGPPAAFSTGITAVITSASTCFTKTTGVITGFIKGQVQ